MAIHEQVGEGKAPVQLLTALGGGDEMQKNLWCSQRSSSLIGARLRENDPRLWGQKGRFDQSP